MIITPEQIFKHPFYDYNTFEKVLYTDIFKMSNDLKQYSNIKIIPYLESHYLGAYLPMINKVFYIWKGDIPNIIALKFKLNSLDYDAYTEKLINIITTDKDFDRFKKMKAFW